jgi:hypothetical protein
MAITPLPDAPETTDTPQQFNSKAFIWVQSLDTFVTEANAQAVDVNANAVLAEEWASKTDGNVDDTDYSAKAWAIGGTGVTDTASAGAAKEWAIETSGTVDGTNYSAKEYALGTQAGTGGSAKSWAQDADAVNGADANDRSAKAWAQGASMTGATLGGSSKDWAQNTSSTVDGSEYSSKEYAVGTQIRGSTGSAKDWAQYTGGTVDGSNYSAKYWAEASEVSAGNAEAFSVQAGIYAGNAEDAVTAAQSAQSAAESARDATLAAYDQFDDRYLGTKSSDPTVDNDGNPLVAGALYFNDVDEIMKLYTGSAWVAAYVSGDGFLVATNNLSDLTNAATARQNLDLEIGVDVQAYDADTAKLDVAQTFTAQQTFSDPVLGTPASGNLENCTVDGTISIGYRNIPQSGAAKTTSYTLETGDVGKLIEVGSGGSITVPDATFSTGDAVVIFNNTSGDVTVTCSIATAYIAGDDTDVASVTLETRGVCNVLFISGTVCVITGNVS